MMEPRLIHQDNVDDVWESLDATGFSHSANVSTVLPKHVSERQSKGRRSWFDSPPPRKLEIAHELTLDKSFRQAELEDMEVLTLTHFTNPPRVDFGKIKPGVARRRRLLISNPHDYDQHVVVERVPKKKHFSVDETEFVVAAEKSLVLTISWMPEDEGPCREMFLFLVDGAYRLQTIVFGHVHAPPQRRREKKGLLGSRIKKPFSVLHTQNFVNIKQSYTPKRPSLKGNVVLTGFNKQKSKSQIESENIAPEPISSVLDNTEVLNSLKSARDLSSPGIKTTPEQPVVVSENRNSVRRSTTYTKIGITADTPDRAVVLDSKTLSVTVNTDPPTSDTGCMLLEEASMLCNSKIQAPVSMEKFDFNSLEGSGSPRLAGCTTPKHNEQSLTHSYISPNTFLRENLAAASTPSIPKMADKTGLPCLAENTIFTKVNSEVCVTETQTVKTVHMELNQSTINVTPTTKRSVQLKSIVQVSPMSFLRESLSNTPDPGNVSASSDTIPSPGLVLNNSVPHEIVVRQLDSVRTSLSVGTIPPALCKASPIVSSPAFPIFIHVDPKGKASRRSTSSLAMPMPKTKNTRRRSESKCSNKKKLFREIPDTQSPRRSTFVVKSKNSAKSSSGLDKKTTSKVSGKVKSTVVKAKERTEARKSKSPGQDMNDIIFSTKTSAEVISTPLAIPDKANLARFTMVVKNPKMLIKNSTDSEGAEAKTEATLNLPGGFQGSKSHGFMKEIDSSTVIKSKCESTNQASDTASNTIVTNEKSPRELFPKSPTTSCLSDVTFVMDIGTPQPLPTSPHPDMSRCGTLTITKSKPSEILLKSTLPGKALFESNLGSDYQLPTSSSSINTEFKPCEYIDGIQSSVSTGNVKGQDDEPVCSAINLSSGLEKISEDYQSNVDSASSTEVSPDAQTGAERKETFVCREDCKMPTSTSEDLSEIKSLKVSASVDHKETFVTLEAMDGNIKDTPTRSHNKTESCQPKKGRMKRQLAQSQILTWQHNLVTVPSERQTVTTQKKRYHSDSSAVLSKSYLEQEDKRQKITNALSQAPSKGRMRRATDSSIKSGAKKGCTGRPGVALNRLVLVRKGHTALPKHPMPFAAKNVYYDERWIEKQERGFVKWLNFILTPPEECQTKAEKVTVDAGSVNLDPKMTVQRLAPTKEVLSLRAYTARRRMNRLRRAACRLYQSEEVIKVIHKIESEVESYRLAVRRDRMIHADVGIKQKVLDLILSYNSLWLRIGLETIYGELITLQSNSDVIGLSRFVLTRLLGNPDVALEFSHPTVPHLYRDGYQEAVSKHVLKKFLMLVYFLDMAKRLRLIDHDPCLFCKNAEWKSSRDLLFQFSKDYMRGEGDITRHLGFHGYSVSHVQLPLDEFDYAVTNLATDLRDGLRLTRVVELLTQTWDLCRFLRVPAISRLQKIHNMELTFKALTQHSHITDPTDGGKVSSRDIVEGHREKTLALLWNIIINFQVDVLIDEAKLQEEISVLTRCLRVRKLWDKLNDDGNSIGKSPGETDVLMDLQICQKNKKLKLLLSWTRAVCAFYNFKVENFTVSFSDGRAFCYLVHHYYPGLLPLSEIQSETSMMFQDQSPDMDDSFSSPMIQQIGSDSSETDVYSKLLNNEKENFRLLYEKVSELGGVPLMLKSLDMSNTIPDERVVITYLAHLCSRLLDLQQEMNAARVIQIAWRRHKIQHQQQHILVRNKAACCIQRKVRKYLSHQGIKRENLAVVKLQRAWRGYLARLTLKQLRWERENREKLSAVIILQRAIRGFLVFQRYQRLKRSVVSLQAFSRGYLVRRRILRDKYAMKIQQFYRGWKLMKTTKEKYTAMKCAVIFLQNAFRRKRERVRRNKAAVQIQSMWKCTIQRRRFLQIRRSIIVSQSHIRMVIAEQKFQVLRLHVVNLQRHYRALHAMKMAKRQFNVMRRAAIVIQSVWRSHVLRKKYERIQWAVVVLQTNFRAYKSRIKFLALHLATVIIQRQYRAQVLMRKCHQEYLILKSRREKSAVVIQRAFKSYLTRQTFVRIRRAAIVIQSAYRGHKIRETCQSLRNSLLLIQQAVRRYYIKRQNQRARESKAATTLQSAWKMYKERQSFLLKQRASQIIQSAFRCHLKHVKLRKAAVTIQRCYRAFRLGKAVRLEIDIMIGAAVTIQVAWKRYHKMCLYQTTKSSTLVIQRWWRAITQRKRYLDIRKAAITLQRQLRNYRHSKDVRNKYCRLRSAAICLQRGCRRRQLLVKHATLMQAKRKGLKQRREFLKKKQAVVVLQRSYRVYQVVKEGKLIQARKSKAAILIQSTWRGFTTCREYKKSQKAAVKIQANLKCYIERRRYLKLQQSVIALQNQLKACLTGRKQRSNYLKLKSAALILQSGFRARKSRKLFQAKKSAIILIQTKLREVLTHRRLLESTILIQRAFRSSQAMKAERRRFLIKKSAVIALQSAWRNYQSRKVSHEQRCVVKLQAATRKYVEQKKYREKRRACVLLQTEWRKYKSQRDFLSMKKASLTIQTRFRAMKAGRRQLEHYNRIRNSVINIQAFSRGFLVRKQLQKNNNAALKIQNCWRRFHLQKQLNIKTEAAILIQRWYHCQKRRKCQQKHYQDMKTSALKIQTAYKRFKARQKFIALKHTCIIVQKYFRGNRQRKHYNNLKTSAIILQSQVRAYQKMSKQRKQFLKVRSAVVCLQTALRHKKQCQELKLNKSAVKIQSAFKGYAERKKFLRRKRSAILIQSNYRGHLARAEYQRLWWASMVIKRWWLETKLKRHKKQKLQQEREQERCSLAAVKIQNWFKLVRNAQAQRRQFLLIRSSVLNLQRLARGYLIRKFVSKTKASITIQKNYRRLCARRSFLHYKRAIIIIQSWVRQHQSKRLLEKRRFAVHILQRNIRAYLFCSLVRQAAQIRELSARKIQVWYRGLKQKQFDAAAKLQSWYRGRWQRRRYLKLRWASVVLQRGFRHQQALRAYYCLQEMYARHRQSVVAEFVLRARREMSAMVVQRAYRHYQQLQEAKKHLHYLLKIQHWIRGRLERIRYLNTQLSVKRIQRCTRRWLGRRYCAATVIQKTVHDWLARRRQEKKIAAIVRLQACWRGHMARRRNSKKIKQMRVRLSEVNAAATEEKKLGHRTNSALDYLLRYKQLAYILDALMHLEVVTRLSGECCLIIVEGNAVSVIYTLIRSCNRSLPHMDLIKYAVSILLNLAKFDRTIRAVYESEDSISTLVELMQIYRDKGPIFSKTCTLLGILALNHRRRQEILQDNKLVEKIRSIHSLTARKQKIEDTRTVTKNKLISVRTSFNCTLLPSTPSKRFPKVRPDWLLRRDSLKVFENPLCAINFVMESLLLNPKR